VPATTYAPLPVAWISLIRPPVPVVAPEKGATPKSKNKEEFYNFVTQAKQTKKEKMLKIYKAYYTGSCVIRLCIFTSHCFIFSSLS
jgi:hypothetical protein